VVGVGPVGGVGPAGAGWIELVVRAERVICVSLEGRC
jgi:hypothetical protein